MSVAVIIRFTPTDLDKARTWAVDNASIMLAITEYGKSLGLLGHRMFANDGDLVVVDLWPSTEAFYTFFANSPQMEDFLGGAGVLGSPKITVLDSLDEIPGTF